MSEHATKGHTIPGLIMVLFIAALAGYGFSAMNSGDMVGGGFAGLLLFGVGTYAVLGLGKQ